MNKKFILILFLVLIAYFFLSQSRSYYAGDSPEYWVVGKTWSIPHPPGYPLYSFMVNLTNAILFFLPYYMVINLWSFLPFVGTLLLLYKTMTLFKLNEKAIYLSLLIYMFLLPVYLYALFAEVFSFHVFIVALITYFISKFTLCPKNKYIYFSFLLLGLSISHHHTIVLFIISWYFLLHNKIKSLIHTLNIKKIIFLAIIGVSFYLYAYLASLFNPPIDYENPVTLENFIRLITRSSYGTFRAYQGAQTNIINQLMSVVTSQIYTILDFKIIGLFFILSGLLSTYKTNKKLFLFFISAILTHLFFYFYLNFPLWGKFISGLFERFLITYYFTLVLLVGFGISFFIDYLKKRSLKFFYQNAYILLFFLVITYYVLPSIKNINLIKNIRFFEKYTKDQLDMLPKNSLFLPTSDTGSYSFAYHHYVLKYRSDIPYIQIGLLTKPFYLNKMKQLYPKLNFDSYIKTWNLQSLIANAKEVHIFSENINSSHGYWVPYGLVWKWYPSEKEALKDKEILIQKNFDVWIRKIEIPDVSKYKDFILVQDLFNWYIERALSSAEYLYTLNEKHKAELLFNFLYKKYPQNESVNQKLLSFSIKNKQCKEIEPFAGFIFRHHKNIIKNVNLLHEYYSKCDRNSQNYLYIERLKKTLLRRDLLKNI